MTKHVDGLKIDLGFSSNKEEVKIDVFDEIKGSVEDRDDFYKLLIVEKGGVDGLGSNETVVKFLKLVLLKYDIRVEEPITPYNEEGIPITDLTLLKLTIGAGFKSWNRHMFDKLLNFKNMMIWVGVSVRKKQLSVGFQYYTSQNRFDLIKRKTNGTIQIKRFNDFDTMMNFINGWRFHSDLWVSDAYKEEE